MSQIYNYNWGTTALPDVALSQPVALGQVALNGVYSNGISTNLIGNGVVRQIVISGDASLLGATFTISGTQNLVNYTEELVLTNDSSTSLNYYDTISSIIISESAGQVLPNTNFTISSDNEDGFFPLIQVNTELLYHPIAYCLAFLPNPGTDPLNPLYDYQIYASLISGVGLGQYENLTADQGGTFIPITNNPENTLQLISFVEAYNNILIAVTQPGDASPSTTLRMNFLQV